MIQDHETPCVGCKYADWYAHAPSYGRCRHPLVESFLAAPMVLRDVPRGEAISKTSLFELQCNARVSP